MKYYLGVDGGGTKIDLILFDENYNLVSEGIGGGVTTSYIELSVVRENMMDAVRNLMKPFNGERIKVEQAFGVLIGPADCLNECLATAMDVPPFESRDEGYMYLMAGGLTDKGGCALIGTGDGAVYINGRNDIYHCGGLLRVYGLALPGSGEQGGGMETLESAGPGRTDDSSLLPEDFLLLYGPAVFDDRIYHQVSHSQNA